MLATAVAPDISAGQTGSPSEAATTLRGLAGHWNCIDATGSRTTRSYEVMDAAPGASIRREEFGREAGMIGDQPFASYERIEEGAAGGLTIESVDGTGPGEIENGSGLRFAGTGYDGKPFAIAYVVHQPGLMERTVVSGAKTRSAERCTLQLETPAPSTCATPNVPPATLHAVSPQTPADYMAAPPLVTVVVRVVLDDRSNVLWTSVLRSNWHPFDSAALASARDSTYRTAVRDCRSLPGIYVFTVAFTRRG